MGARHASNLTYLVAAAEVAAIMDVDSARAEEIAARCGGARIYTDAEQLISAPEVDAVVIAAPNQFSRRVDEGVHRCGQAGALRKATGDRGRGSQWSHQCGGQWRSKACAGGFHAAV